MKKIAKYIVKTIGDFGGYGNDVFVKEFNNYEKAITYYKKQLGNKNDADEMTAWYDAKVEFIDGIAEAEKELAELKMKMVELETAIRIAKES